MKYPTMQEVEEASRYRLCVWTRFLPSPGTSHIGQPDFQSVLDREVPINKRICERLKELGGFTPEMSKDIGWEE